MQNNEQFDGLMELYYAQTNRGRPQADEIVLALYISYWEAGNEAITANKISTCIHSFFLMGLIITNHNQEKDASHVTPKLTYYLFLGGTKITTY